MTFRSNKRKRDGRRLLVALALLGALHLPGAPFEPLAAEADVLIAGAAARGAFGWEIIGGYERPLPWIEGKYPVEIPLRLEGHFATRHRVTNIVLSSYLLARFDIPGFDESDFGPYVAAGPGFHIQGAWSDLEAFGGVLTQGETVLKWHFLAGATLVRGARADIFTEGRYTKPGPYDFDYLALGLRLHGTRPSSP